MRGVDAVALDACSSYAAQTAGAGGGRPSNLARRRRFCAMAASVNSSCAPHGPRSRRRPSFRMRLRWANSISTRLRSRRDCSKAWVLARLNRHLSHPDHSTGEMEAGEEVDGAAVVACGDVAKMLEFVE